MKDCMHLPVGISVRAGFQEIANKSLLYCDQDLGAFVGKGARRADRLPLTLSVDTE